MNNKRQKSRSTKYKLYLTHLVLVGACSLTGLNFQSAFAAETSQQNLRPNIVNNAERQLKYNWPAIRVGTASYEEGPTGVTVLHFPKKAYVAMDIRGGGPGTINAPYVDFGYNIPELDSIVIAGGSWYGLEAATAVATALKDDGLRDGNAFSSEPSIAMSLGSIVFDFGARRLNEIYPDKKLAQAAYRNAKTGSFPLGPIGAGRNVMTGGYFGCSVHSGQGAAFKQIGDLKIAAFTVVNSYGLVVDRNGNTDSCYTENGLERELPIAELIRQRIDTLTSNESRDRLASNKNTTVSVLVVNQALEPSLLKRLAAQVHTSMGRYIQPYATLYDGDVFYVVSTAEIDQEKINSVDIGVLAGEVMWDAALSATPKQPEHPKIGNNIAITTFDLESMTGDYYFSDEAILRISLVQNKLTAKAIGKRDIFAISKNPKLLTPLSTTSFTVSDRFPLILDFSFNRKVIVNPGPWQQVGLVKPN